MKWFEDAISDLVRQRGMVAAWELAAAAAIIPYLAGPAFTTWLQPDAGASSYTLAISLAFTIALLAGLRAALTAVQASAGLETHFGSRSDVTRTLTTAAPPEGAPDRSASTGLPLRDALKSVIETHDYAAEPGLLGLVRFANCPAMIAFDAVAARRVMRSFGRRFETAVACTRPVAQINDDTFAIWFAGREAEPIAEAELKSIAYVLAQEIVDGDLTVAPDIHVGSAWLSAETDTLAGLISCAQAALTPLKRFAPVQRAPGLQPQLDGLAERFAMEQALRRAVREGQLSLRYQPFIDAAAGRVAGAEVLLRWRHPVLGDVPPARFVPLLEETGLIHEIGLWTFNNACRQLREWRAAGQSELHLAVNLSAVQLQNASLKPLLERTVAAHGLSPHDVELELTETAAMEDQVRTVELFHELRQLGFGIAIDDFGNGHSNLNYLKNLPFTKLKIDREFVTHVDSRPGSRAICNALVELGAGLGISVLAEGVERREEVATLMRLGCHVFQGFHFARPLTASDLTAKLLDPAWGASLRVASPRAGLEECLAS